MSRKPRRHERLAMYKKMLKSFEKDIYYIWTAGFCRELSRINIKLKRSYHIQDYPELMKYKPLTTISVYWWPIRKSSNGREIRMKILRKIIREMSK